MIPKCELATSAGLVLKEGRVKHSVLEIRIVEAGGGEWLPQENGRKRDASRQWIQQHCRDLEDST